MAWESRLEEWSRPPEPSPDASGILVQLPRAATECEFDLMPEPGRVMQKGSDLGCEIEQLPTTLSEYHAKCAKSAVARGAVRGRADPTARPTWAARRASASRTARAPLSRP